MAEYRLEFEADSGAAERSIFNLRKSIKEVTKEFEKSEIGAEDFIEAAGEISRLKKEYDDARNAVANIDKAYRDLNKAIEANFAVHTKATSAATKYHKDVLQLAQESAKEQDRLRNKQFKADVEAFDMKLKIAAVASKKIAAQEKAIMEFRAGMGARGAIPAIASPIRGGINYPGIAGGPASPGYIEAMKKAAAKAAAQAKASGGVTIPAELKFQPLSLAYYESKLKALSAQARLISPESKKWKELNTDILKAERGIQRIQKRQRLGPTMGQRAGAAGGAFLYGGGLGGGVGSALGGIAGGLAGGVPGAFAGAAIGQAVDNLGTALAGITSQASQVQQLQRGLALASIDAKDFAEAQAAVADVSARLFIPLEQVTKSFSQLRVNTKQYGLSVEETKQILEGTILAVSAFGGSADDVDGAMRAVVQILSKGSVQAEELRGQLGERFPGAVIKFAQANKLSFDELQDRLKEGTIGIKEFVTFAKDNYEDYAEFSKTLATAPEFAGRRLAKALEEMQMAIGQVFGSSGATIQDFASQALKDITLFVVNNKELLSQLGQDFAVVFSGIMSVVAEAGKFIIKVLAPVFSYIGGVIRQLRVMTGAADAATAKAEMDAANVIIQRTGMGRDAFLSGQPRPGSVADKIEFDKAQERYKRAEKRFKEAGGKAALPPETGTPPSLVFGGPGAGVDMTAGADKAAKEKAAKQQSLESFERLRDQLANAYNQAEIERIKARYELEKQLQDNLRDVQELGANRLERLNLQFIRNLQNAERKRTDAMMDAQLDLMQVQGKVAGGAGIGVTGGGGFSTAQLQKASSEAARFTGIANMCSESVKAFYKSLGISLPGVTAWADTVRKAGKTMTDWSKLQAGDIVATGRPGDTPHVGVYTGGNNVFHQSRKRGLKAGNYPDLDYFKSGYFVRPSAMDAGAPRKVGSNENRDMLAAANAEIKRGNILLAEKNGLLLKDSEIMKVVASYVDEAFGVPNLELDNKLLAERNRLTAEGVDENTINYRLKLIEMESRHTHLTKLFDEELKKANLTEEQRKVILDAVTQGLNRATAAEKAKNDETLRGIQIQKEAAMISAIKMATPLGGAGLAAGFIGDAGAKYEEAIKEGRSQDEAARFAELQNQLTLLETRNGAVKSSVLAIGDAFATAMTTGVAGLISGTATAQEVFASFLKSVGDALLQAAQQMIATYIAIGIAKIFAGLGGGGNFTGGTSSAVPTDAAGWGSSFQTSLPGLSGDIGRTPIGFAKGAAFSNSIVTAPTMFKFADGGAMKAGLMGEAGPEAIMPLSRGAGGRLGVDASGLREAMDRQSGGGNGSPVLNMSFQSTSINGVEYVSREQLEQAMAETRRASTRDGAKRGMTMTLDRIQNSSSTRRKVGI